MGSGLLERDLQKVVPVISVKPKGRAGCRGSRGSGNEITATRCAKEGQSKPWPECFQRHLEHARGTRECSHCQSSQTCSTSSQGSAPMLPVPG